MGNLESVTQPTSNGAVGAGTKQETTKEGVMKRETKTRCSIKSCPLWKRVKLIMGIALLASPVVAMLTYIGITDWRGLLFVMGVMGVILGAAALGILLIDSSE